MGSRQDTTLKNDDNDIKLISKLPFELKQKKNQTTTCAYYVLQNIQVVCSKGFNRAENIPHEES